MGFESRYSPKENEQARAQVLACFVSGGPTAYPTFTLGPPYHRCMRTPKEYVAADGSRTYKVRFRQGECQTSETFRRLSDAKTFAALLDSGDHASHGVATALAWLAQNRNERDMPSFKDWHERYVDQLTGITPRTRADYRAMRRRYLSELEPLPITLINRTHVTSLVNDMDRDGFSTKTIKNVTHMLSSCMALAVEEGHIVKNPCRGVRLPAAKLDAVEARFLLHEEVGRLIEATPIEHQALVVFLIGTGMRWSEATALQGRHLNLEAGTVRVEQAWKYQGSGGGGWKIGQPKTVKGRRTVNAAVAALAAAAAQGAGPDQFVFRTRNGNPIRHSNFYSRVWKPTCERAGFDPAPRIHDLRHTHASWLISDGQSLEQVQDQLGHDDIRTTRRVYGHLLPALGVEVGRSASAGLARALGHSTQGDRLLPALLGREEPEQGAGT